jgi:predicted outer membrane repeat protein
MYRFLKSLFCGDSRRTARPTRLSFRPTLEACEERLVPSTLWVTNPADNATPGTLRAAVAQADFDASRGISDQILFTRSVQGRTFNLNSPLQLTGTQQITIYGLNDSITISGRSGGLVVAYGANVALVGLNFQDCSTTTSGGAIANNGYLNLNACSFEFNHAGWYGGAIVNNGILTMNKSTFIDNSARLSGGAIYNSGTINDYSGSFDANYANSGAAIYNTGHGVLYVLSTGNSFAYNHATNGSGGAIDNLGYAIVVNGTFTGNTSTLDGGAIANFGTVNVTSSTFNNNSASLYGGAFYDAPGDLWYVWGSFNGNHAGRAGNNYYTPSKVG